MAEQPPHLKVRARWKSEEDIVNAIDRKIKQIARLRSSAWMMEAQANQQLRSTCSTTVYATTLLEHAKRKQDRASRIESGHLLHLKRKLAEFRTALLPGCGDDRSIPK